MAGFDFNSLFGPTWGNNQSLEDFPAPIVPGTGGTWGGTSSWGRWNPAIGHTPFSQPATKKKKALGGAKLAQQNTMASYMDMLNKQQQSVLQKMLEDAQKQRQGQLASLAGFGAALQGYSHDLWGQTDASYRNAAAAQQSMAQGLGGQVGSGVAAARAQEASLAGSLGYTGGSELPTAEAATAQVASEGGKDSGGMMGQVGTAWGGYGATRPEYIGFMTGQNQMQLEREGLQSDKDVRLEFAKLAMDNPKTAQDMYLADQANKREVLSSKLAQQTLAQNMQMKQAQLKQQWFTARANAKDDAARRRVDAIYKAAMVANDQVMAGISQQRADATTKSATASMISANASADRAAETARNNKWKREHPYATTKQAKYAPGTWNEKVASAMYNTPGLFKDSGATGPKGTQKRADYAFNILWPQMAAYIPKAQQKAARILLKQRLINASRKYVPKATGSGGLYAGGGGGPTG